jgi:hypothetical protein
MKHQKESESPHQVSTIQVIPDELVVHEHWHDIPYAQPIPCWTHVTQGLSVYGQKELVFTLRRTEMAEQGESPSFVPQLVKHILALAKQGRLVDAGGYTSMMLTDPEQEVGIPFNLLYLHPLPLAGISLPSPALTVRFMSAEEHKVYMSFGAMRLMSSWANHYRYFPYPPWSDLPAPDIVSLQRFQSSILNRSPRLHLPESTVNMEGEEIVLRLRSGARESLARQMAAISPSQPVAFLPGLDPRADACLAWIPEQNQTAMNMTPVSKFARVAGCFMLFVPEQQETSARVFEDGFTMLLSTDVWMRLREAMFSGQPSTVPASDKRFRLEHTELR